MAKDTKQATSSQPIKCNAEKCNASGKACSKCHTLNHFASVYRQGLTGPRRPEAIGMQTLRLGDSVGEHTVYLAGPGERIELSHRALSRENFATGAIRAARWAVAHPPHASRSRAPHTHHSTAATSARTAHNVAAGAAADGRCTRRTI